MKRHVSLDTNVFVGRRFDYANTAFKTLAARVKERKVGVVLTTVAVRECKANLEELVREACAKLGKGQRDASMLRGDSILAPLLSDVDADAAVGRAVASFDGFLKELEVEVIDVSSVNSEDVFDDYFERKQPFGVGKKKSEFPDAFALKALQQWAERTENKVSFVSGDDGAQSACNACDRIEPVNRLEEFLESVALFDDKILKPLHAQLLIEEAGSIQKAAAENFEGRGFVLDDQDGDVLSVSVTSVEFGDWSVLDVDYENGEALCEAEAVIQFTAELQYDDLDTASWDSEDKRYYIHHQIEEEVERTECLSVVIKVGFDPADLVALDIREFRFEESNDIQISSSRSDFDH